MNELPTSAAELNAWLPRHFAIFEGPPRAYFELPFKIRFEQGAESLEYIHRCTYMCVGFVGPEVACATRVASMIDGLFFEHLHVLEDASIQLFIRAPFRYEMGENGRGQLWSRLAFWNEETNRKIRGSLMFRPDGGPYNNVERV